jgi:MFS superfamily sulfate permease-like transporter
MTIAIVVVVAIAGFAVFVGLLWACAWAIDKGIKEYIDYARKGKDDGSD